MMPAPSQTLYTMYDNGEMDHQVAIRTGMQQDVFAMEEVVNLSLPPSGPLSRPEVKKGETLYVMRHGYYGRWRCAKIIDIVKEPAENGSDKEYILYMACFENRKSKGQKLVSAKQMAYPNPSPVILPVGTRVVAHFEDEGRKENYYAGLIAEPPTAVNKYRYLVFFDDGYAQYVVHDKVLLVCESSRQVWKDIHPDSRDFMKHYLEHYPIRPMLRLKRGEIIKTEWNGKWWIAQVSEIDGSLVEMYFRSDGRREWIYRGSTRLGPLFIELQRAASFFLSRDRLYMEHTHTDFDESRLEESGDAEHRV